ASKANAVRRSSLQACVGSEKAPLSGILLKLSGGLNSPVPGISSTCLNNAGNCAGLSAIARKPSRFSCSAVGGVAPRVSRSVGSARQTTTGTEGHSVVARQITRASSSAFESALTWKMTASGSHELGLLSVQFDAADV